MLSKAVSHDWCLCWIKRTTKNLLVCLTTLTSSFRVWVKIAGKDLDFLVFFSYKREDYKARGLYPIMLLID